MEFWFGVLLLFWEEFVDFFVLIFDFLFLGVFSLGILLVVVFCVVFLKCIIMILVLFVWRFFFCYFDNVCWINLLRKFVIISIYRLLIVVEWMIVKFWVVVFWYYILMLYICNKFLLFFFFRRIYVMYIRFFIKMGFLMRILWLWCMMILLITNSKFKYLVN